MAEPLTPTLCAATFHWIGKPHVDPNFYAAAAAAALPAPSLLSLISTSSSSFPSPNEPVEVEKAPVEVEDVRKRTPSF